MSKIQTKIDQIWNRYLNENTKAIPLIKDPRIWSFGVTILQLLMILFFLNQIDPDVIDSDAYEVFSFLHFLIVFF